MNLNRHDLVLHKKYPKKLDALPTFVQAKRRKYPKPFDTMGNKSLYTFNHRVSDKHSIYLYWKDGQLLTDTKFYAWLMLSEGKDLYPLFELHYHPSHKPLHAKLPCNPKRNYLNRTLPGGFELNLKIHTGTDPRTEAGRFVLIDAFCKSCGISLGGGSLC